MTPQTPLLTKEATQLMNTLGWGLAGAGAGGLATGLAAGSDRGPVGETPQQRRSRILRNALTGIVLGGGAGALGAYGYGQLAGALPKDDVGPISGALHSVGARAAGAGGMGMLAHRGQLAEQDRVRESLFSRMFAADGEQASGGNARLFPGVHELQKGVQSGGAQVGKPQINAILEEIFEGPNAGSNFAKAQGLFGGQGDELQKALVDGGLRSHPDAHVNRMNQLKGLGRFGGNAITGKNRALSGGARTLMMLLGALAPEVISSGASVGGSLIGAKN